MEAQNTAYHDTADHKDPSLAAQPPVLPAAAEPDEQLLSELSHSLGNIIHRMYYWTGVLEDAVLEDATSEGAAPEDSAPEDDAVLEIKSSLASLHEIIGRTMELVRPVESHPVTASAADLELSIGRRFDCVPPGSDADCLSGLATPVTVDPQLLGRVLALIAELAGPGSEVSKPPARLATKLDQQAAQLYFQLELAASAEVASGPRMELVAALCSRFMAAFGASVEMAVSHAGTGRTLAVSLCFGLQAPTPSC
ncbi:MAG: hypothetical protein H8E45_12340 [Proteobacteria bacterium]|nr:hypothetical protein [Pseudomonadota bacterium]